LVRIGLVLFSIHTDGEQVRTYAIFHPYPYPKFQTLYTVIYLTQCAKNMTVETDVTHITAKQ